MGFKDDVRAAERCQMVDVIVKEVEKEFSVVQVTASGATWLHRPMVTIIGNANEVAGRLSRSDSLPSPYHCRWRSRVEG